MPTAHEIVEHLLASNDWNARVALIRTIPETFGMREHAAVYAEVARKVYVPHLKSTVGYVHWRPAYELERVQAAYEHTRRLTADFTSVNKEALARTLTERPETLLVFRLLLGLTGTEFAEAASAVEGAEISPNKSFVNSMEAGRPGKPKHVQLIAGTIDQAMSGRLFPRLPQSDLRSKIDKPDTALGWDSVRAFARQGVPLPIFLHQRLYGGAFRQLLDATGTSRGDLLEDPVEELFKINGIRYVRTGGHDQAAIARDFGLTVRPAPDFVIYSERGALRAILECKAANDGGTARDKAARFAALRREPARLGGIPVFAVLSGGGWRRTRDALGPVIRDTDGRTFTPGTLAEILAVDPFPSLFAPKRRRKSGH